jgi:hypothetical protein
MNKDKFISYDYQLRLAAVGIIIITAFNRPKVANNHKKTHPLGRSGFIKTKRKTNFIFKTNF